MTQEHICISEKQTRTARATRVGASQPPGSACRSGFLMRVCERKSKFGYREVRGTILDSGAIRRWCHSETGSHLLPPPCCKQGARGTGPAALPARTHQRGVSLGDIEKKREGKSPNKGVRAAKRSHGHGTALQAPRQGAVPPPAGSAPSTAAPRAAAGVQEPRHK